MDGFGSFDSCRVVVFEYSSMKVDSLSGDVALAFSLVRSTLRNLISNTGR